MRRDGMRYGCKGGDGPTRGRKKFTRAYVLPGGERVTRGMFVDHPFAVCCQRDESDTLHVYPQRSREIAESVSDSCHRDGYLVHFVIAAEAP